MRWGITQDLYLNATVNPDFSQVEADAPQLDINNTFNLFSPSVEPFSSTAQITSSTFQNLVYTRNIADPDYGLKLTGKSGRHTYGVLTANDRSTSFIMPRSLGSSVTTLTSPAGEQGVSNQAVESDISIARYRPRPL